jgi:hypothetical protein
MTIRQTAKQWYLRFTEFKWIVGIAEYDSDTILDTREKLKIHWIKGTPKSSWFADPFILSETDNHINILVEEFFYANKKGRISKLVVNRHSWRLEQIVPVIDISTHLSFPAYFRENGKVFIYPESTRSGKLTLYEYDESNAPAIPVKELSFYPLADAVIWYSADRPYILATTTPRDNGKVLDFYPYAGNPSDKPVKQFCFNTYMARNAGLPFNVNGRQIRPAQDCTGHYGSCIVLQEIIERGSDISFREIRRLRSPLFLYQEGFHTFNVYENRLAAVDAQGFRYGFAAQVFYHIREHFR